MFISGTKTSKKAENVLMTWNTLDNHQHQLTSNTSIKSRNSCTKIVDWQLETLLTLLAFQGDHTTPFQKIFWADNSWFLHHDNAPSHTALILRDHFGKNSTHIVPQPPYLPDFSPCTRGVSWSLPVFSIKKTLNSQGNLKKNFIESIDHWILHILPIFQENHGYHSKKTFSLSRQTIRRAIFRLLQNWRSAALRVSVPSMRKGDSWTGHGLESTAGAIIFPNSKLLMCCSPLQRYETVRCHVVG